MSNDFLSKRTSKYPSTELNAWGTAIRQGNRLLLARAMSLVENESVHAHTLLQALFPYTGRAHIIGITGAPGTGKSTLAAALAQSYRAAGFTVGVVAIDPTSPFTGGALLGDRVRMRALSGDPGIFIRSMATRGSLGGLSKTTGEVVSLLDAAGFARILVETVGVGQAEVEIARTAHTTLVVEAPGFGDEVQAIKAGILEIADILVVNKADLPGVDRTVKALEMMLELEAAPRTLRHHGQLIEGPSATPISQAIDQWQVSVLKTVAAQNEGIGELRDQIEAHRQYLQISGELSQREQVRIATTLEQILQSALNRQLHTALPLTDATSQLEAIQARTIDPYTVAAQLLGTMAPTPATPPTVQRWAPDIYNQAYRFAALAHQGQTVPGSALPYITHVSLVSMEVIAALIEEPGRDETLAVQCALLHDVLEDTSITYDQLCAEFGEAVANGVLALSKDIHLAKADQMADSLRRIQQQPPEVWIVKLADRIVNLQPQPAHWTPEKITRYREEAQQILGALAAASPVLAKRLAEKIAHY